MRITSHETILSAHLIRRSEHLCNQNPNSQTKKDSKNKPCISIRAKKAQQNLGIISIKNFSTAKTNEEKNSKLQ